MTERTSTPAPPPIDPAQYREVMGHYPTGVTVVTGTSPDGDPIGMVVGTFTAVSLDPPLVAFMPTTTSGHVFVDEGLSGILHQRLGA